MYQSTIVQILTLSPKHQPRHPASYNLGVVLRLEATTSESRLLENTIRMTDLVHM